MACIGKYHEEPRKVGEGPKITRDGSFWSTYYWKCLSCGKTWTEEEVAEAE